MIYVKIHGQGYVLENVTGRFTLILIKIIFMRETIVWRGPKIISTQLAGIS